MDAEPKIMDFNLGLVLSLLKGGRKVNRNCWQLGSLDSRRRRIHPVRADERNHV